MTTPDDSEILSDDELEGFARRLEAYSEQLSPAERRLLGNVLLRATVPSRAPASHPAQPPTSGPASGLADLLTRVPRMECLVAVTVGDVVIELEAGLVFGSGHHPTTRLALDLLARYLRPGGRMLDLGTGTGVLSIAAAKLGAASVLALDVESDAAWLAARNVARNGVGDVVRVEMGSIVESWSLPEPPAGRFDVITANLGAALIDHLASELIGALAPGGMLIAGGVVDHLETLCRAGLARAGATVIDRARAEEWRALVATRLALLK